MLLRCCGTTDFAADLSVDLALDFLDEEAFDLAELDVLVRALAVADFVTESLREAFAAAVEVLLFFAAFLFFLEAILTDS